MIDSPHTPFLKNIQPALQPLVTLFSVWVGFKLKLITDRDAKLQKKIVDIKEEIDIICEISIAYWSRLVPKGSRTGIDLQEECKIKSSNHNVNKEIVSLSDKFKPNDYINVTTLVTNLRRASSGEDFETDAAREMSPTAIMETLRCASDLKREIEYSILKKKWWHFFS